MRNFRSIALKSSLCLLVFAFVANANAQLVVNGTNDVDALAETISGNGVSISNAQITCASDGFGTYNALNTNLGASEGIMLTSGTINKAIGPNDEEDETEQQYTAGSSLLDEVTNRTTYDACMLEFDIVPRGDTLSFDFVFASEEYNEWVGSQYNDVFGFFISGPGITGDPGIGNDHNIALIPNTSTAIAINNVNANLNDEYFFDNPNGGTIQYDGFTVGLKAISEVIPCETYHLKLVIADASDRKWDSGVFIEKIESNDVEVSYATANGMDEMIEGCNEATITFTRQNALPIAEDVVFYLGGSAVNGTDYPLVGVNPNVNDPKIATIPANQFSVDVVIDPTADGLTEGAEEVVLYLGNGLCPGQFLDSLTIPVLDELPASVTPQSDTVCLGTEVQFNSTGGDTFSWAPATFLTDSNIPNPTANPTASIDYTMTTTAGACVATVDVHIEVVELDLSPAINTLSCNNNGDGSIDVTINGGFSPFVIEWNGPNGFTADVKEITDLEAGDYTINVTDVTGCSASGTYTVIEPEIIEIDLSSDGLPLGQHIACNGGSDGSIDSDISGGTAPYIVHWSGPNGFTSMNEDLEDLVAGTYNIAIEDANGCAGSASFTLTEPSPILLVASSVTNVECFEQTDGAAEVSVSGGTAPLSVQWNTSPATTGNVVSGLEAGIYTATATDGYGCEVQIDVEIDGPASTLEANVDSVKDVLCFGRLTGSAFGSASGGTAPYSFFWSTNPLTFSDDITNVPSGLYYLTVTDANGCRSIDSTWISSPSEQHYAYVESQIDIECHGDSTGSGTLFIGGGSGSYSVEWNTTPPQYGPTITGLPAGTYWANVTDDNGCDHEKMVPLIITEPDPISGTLVPGLHNGGYEISCFGESDGSIDLTLEGGTPPYYLTWTGPNLYTGIEDVGGLTAGWYFIAMHDSKGCTWNDSIELKQPTEIQPIAIATPTACQGSATGAIDLSVSGGETGYAISWSGPNGFTSSSEDLSTLEAGTYTATVVDAIGCSTTIDVIISQPGNLTLSDVQSIYPGPYNVSCSGATDGSIDITVGGGSLPYSFEWTGPNGFTSTDEDIGNLEAGDYTIVVTDGNGCTISNVLNISEPDPVYIVLTPSDYNGSNIGCSNGSDGNIDAAISGGVVPYTISWTGPNGYTNGIEDIFSLAPGTYYIEVVDQNNCSALDSVTLTAPDTLITSVASPVLNGGFNITCFGSSTGSIDLDIVGGVGPFQTDWTGPNGFTSSDEDLVDIAAGLYAVFITDANGCTSDQVITLTEAPEIMTSSTSPTYNGGWNVSCAEASDGSIDLSISGGVPAYTIAWSGPNGFTSSDEVIIGLSAGIYQAVVSDENGCTDTLDVELTAPEPLSANLDPTTFANGANTSCGGNSDGEIDLSISGGTPSFNILWSGPNGFSSTDEDINGLIEGTYVVNITDDNGCALSDSVTLIAPDSLLLEVAATELNGGFNISCFGNGDGEIDLDIASGEGPFTYAWTGPNGFISSDQDLNGLMAGTYIVMVNDTFGCSATASITLTEPAILDLSADALTYPGGDNISCTGESDGEIDLTVNGGTAPFTFAWTGPNGTFDTEDLTGLSAGVYALTVVDANGCSDTLSVELTEPASISSDLVGSIQNGGTGVSCNGGADATIELDILGGSTPFGTQWSGPNGFTSTDEDLSGVEAGDYTVVITDANGCSITDSINITEPDTLISDLYSPVFGGGYNIACAGDTSGVLEASTLGGVPGYSYSWSGPNGFASTDMNIGGLHAGLYTLTTTDSNGCSVVDTLTLSQPSDTLTGLLEALVQPSGSNISCFGGNDGAIDATLIGGIPPYLLEWRGPDAYISSDEDISGLEAGEYELVVIDVNECPLTLTIELTEPDTNIFMDATLSEYPGNVNVSCADSDDGSIDLTIAGGSPNYVVDWSGPNGFNSNETNIDSLLAGVYTVQVEDTNGCVYNDDIEIIAPEILAPTLDPFTFPSGNNISCFGMNNGSIDGSINGGTPGYNVLWTGPNGFNSTDLIVDDLMPGQYCMTVIDTNACVAEICTTLTEPTELELTATSDTASCGMPTATVDLSVNGGSAPFNFEWNGQAGGEDLNNASAGDQNVVVTDVNGCEATLTQNVFGTDAVEGVLNVVDILCNSDNSGAIDLELSSGTAPFVFEWSNGEQSEDISDLFAGTYTVNVLDSNGCELSATEEVYENDAMTSDSELSNYNGFNISTFQGNDGWIELMMGGSTAPFTYLWNTGDTTARVEGLAAGSYHVVITDANGCERMLDFELTEPEDLVLPTGFSPNGDGANDGFVVQGIEAYPSNSFKVVNRWGNTVYEAGNYKNQWNGENMHGEALPDATYFVILSVNNGQRSLAGYVDLRR